MFPILGYLVEKSSQLLRKETAMSSPTLVIAIGNVYRNDDGVGPAVIRMLQAKGLADTSCLESNGDGAALIEAWTAADKVILIDAVASGAKPGTIHRLDALAQPLPACLAFPSTHAFGVAEAVQLAHALRQLPTSLLLYGIEGKNFAVGTTLSPEVEAAAHEVVEQILQEVQGQHRITH
jgi:hydrogenase maturation protease